MENSETHIWADFAFNCKYISEETKDRWHLQTHEIGKMLNHMIENPEKYQRQEKKIIDNRQKSLAKEER
jgi:hypothetical protein